jgi:nucleoside-diphosphate-sugar epimerase
MSRVLVTGGAGTIGTAVVRRLLSDPAYDVRVSDARPVPLWMREGCELHTGDLRLPAQARAATKGCSHVIHLARAGGVAAASEHPHTTIELENALHGAVVRGALERDIERFVYVSSELVFERAELFPTPEEHLAECPAPSAASGFATLSGERYCEAANREHGLAYAICRPFGAYGPPTTAAAESSTEAFVAELIGAALDGGPPGLQLLGQRTCTPTHVDDIAAGIVLALGSSAALNEDFNLGGSRELALRDLARLVWEACDADPAALTPKRQASKRPPPGRPAPAHAAGAERSRPSVEKALELLGWQAQIDLERGLAETVQAMREHHAATRGTALAG